MTFPFRRRTLLGAGIWVAAAGAAVSLPRWVRNSPWRSFTPQEAHTVDAICAQLIPADQDPGAREAGVVNYIDIQLARSFRRYRPIYRRGLAAIDSTSRSMAKQPAPPARPAIRRCPTAARTSSRWTRLSNPRPASTTFTS